MTQATDVIAVPDLETIRKELDAAYGSLLDSLESSQPVSLMSATVRGADIIKAAEDLEDVLRTVRRRFR